MLPSLQAVALPLPAEEGAVEYNAAAEAAVGVGLAGLSLVQRAVAPGSEGSGLSEQVAEEARGAGGSRQALPPGAAPPPRRPSLAAKGMFGETYPSPWRDPR